MNTTQRTLGLLRGYECRNITNIEPGGSWPIVWERAQGVHVWDAAGKRYLDLTAAFGVAAAGHGNLRVVRAGQRQMRKLLHAMGDVHPHALKAELALELSRITFERWCKYARRDELRESRFSLPFEASRTRVTRASGKTIFCNSGFEAVEAALKTAMLATGKPGVITFEGAYHGLGYGTLNVTHREHFRASFRSQLREFGHFVPFPTVGQATSPAQTNEIETKDRRDGRPTMGAVESRLHSLVRSRHIGAILVEPIQGRGGINIAPPEFLPMLRKLCDEHGALLILDEIYTGFGRTGKWFACEHSGVVPDIICLGKALAGGFPLSACVGRASVMDAAWPPSTGEAIHTSTFLGHPVGCAMALAQLSEIRRLRLCERSAKLGQNLLRQVQRLRAPCVTLHARGMGLMAGLELRKPDGSPAARETLRVVKAMLQRGFILLPEGEHGNILSFTPPLTITEAQLMETVKALRAVLERA